MAIYHLSVKTVSRSAGRSSTAAAAYRSGEKIHDERTGETFDYARKSGIVSTGIIARKGSPKWATDREQLWNQAEQSEKRKNSTVAREFVVALPEELNQEQRQALVVDFSKQMIKRHGFVVDFAIHKPNAKGDDRNHHAHILCTTRKIEKEGFTSKTRELDQRKSGAIDHWREQWSKTTNRHLSKAGIEASIDHRSLKDQGVNREPTVHLGHNVTALERGGFETRRGDINRAINETNNNVIDFDAAIRKLKAKKAEIKKLEAEKQKPSGVKKLYDSGLLGGSFKKKTDAERLQAAEREIKQKWQWNMEDQVATVQARSKIIGSHIAKKIDAQEERLKEKHEEAPKKKRLEREKTFKNRVNTHSQEVNRIQRRLVSLKARQQLVGDYGHARKIQNKDGLVYADCKCARLAAIKLGQKYPNLFNNMLKVQEEEKKRNIAAKERIEARKIKALEAKKAEKSHYQDGRKMAAKEFKRVPQAQRKQMLERMETELAKTVKNAPPETRAKTQAVSDGFLSKAREMTHGKENKKSLDRDDGGLSM